MAADDRLRRTIRVPLLAFVAAACTLAARPAAADYSLAAGDIVEMSVVGQPDLRQRAQIDVDGKLSLPLVGSVRAAGFSITELRSRLQDQIGRKAVRQRTPEGREMSVLIEPDEVNVDIAEYRPVYVNGDVSKPGEVRFRSSLTVRQAVSLAGGYDLMRFRIDNPFLQAADLESDMKAYAAEYARQQARIARLEAELSQAPEVTTGSLRAPVSAEFASQIRSLEVERFKLRGQDLARDTSTLKTLIAFGETELKSLKEQSDKEEEGTKLDEADLKRLTGLFEQGNLAMPRVTDTRRLLLLGSTRLLQTRVQIERVRRERELDQQKLSKIDDNRRLEIVGELQDARVQMEAVRAKMAATGQKLLYTSTVRSQLIRGTGGRPNIVVVRRKQDGSQAQFRAEEDAELLPGDVVEVSLVAELTPPPDGAGSAPSGPAR